MTINRRVLDKMSGSYGTAVEAFGRDRYRVEWDEPTPYQDSAKPRIPGTFFDWSDVLPPAEPKL